MVKSDELIILTGAGFSKNFGGFLGSEMWSLIFNEPSLHRYPKLRALLLNDFDYESVYYTVTNSPSYSDEEKKVFKEALERAYEVLDDRLGGWVMNGDNPSSLNTYSNGGLGSLLGLKCNEQSPQKFIFTLNQDLLLERLYGYHSACAPAFLSTLYSHRGKLLKKDFVRLPEINSLGNFDSDLGAYSGSVYIKLHGSYGWLSSSGESRMIVGKTKKDDIKNEPLLNKYFDLFERVLNEGSKKLLIIGYGFQDQHVNEVLLNAVKNSELKIYIIKPGSAQDLSSFMNRNIHYAYPLWEALYGYFGYTLRELFPPNQSTTPMWTQLENLLKS